MNNDKILLRVRVLASIFVIGLILSGVTAFPLVWELGILERLFGQGTFMEDIFPPMAEWISHIHSGIEEMSTEQPFIFYGTDWLAFGHIAIGIFMIGVIVNPVKNIWVIEAAMIACILVIPTALICGPIRGIPFFWQLIDCSFGVFGIIPLWITRSWIKKIEAT